MANDEPGPHQPHRVTEQLLYSVVRLWNQTPTEESWGTGFIFSLFWTANTSYKVIITNKHVIKDWDTCSFSFIGCHPSGAPNLSGHIPVQINNFKAAWAPHPDPSVDLAMIPIRETIVALVKGGQRPFIIPLGPNIIMNEHELKELVPVEQILTVGYPGMLWDHVHNIPLFHRGYTATPPYIDFQGRKEFLVDIATWPGASGSPVMLFNDGPWMDRQGNTNLGGERAYLLGVVQTVAVQDVEGNVTLQDGPTTITASAAMQVPTNLGGCISASRILDFEPLCVSLGLEPPPGYVMRANAT